ncbi:hypothetical protein DMP14_15980 [Pseudonocardia sp. Ae707_Ps2]
MTDPDLCPAGRPSACSSFRKLHAWVFQVALSWRSAKLVRRTRVLTVLRRPGANSPTKASSTAMSRTPSSIVAAPRFRSAALR